MDYDFKNSNPREMLKAWEAQAFSLLTTKGFPISFKGITELMNNSEIPLNCSKAVRIVFWGRVWRQAKTKEEVTTAWNYILDAVKNSNFQGFADYADGKIAASLDSKETNEMITPVLDRIAELKLEGLDQSEIIERGFKKETVSKVFSEVN
jgi:Tfp pilus assembly ATPase PilU|tara:strand:- start:367 stop:819 length:453 start_codon:yes stop_codon:yes gene_type:complete